MDPKSHRLCEKETIECPEEVENFTPPRARLYEELEKVPNSLQFLIYISSRIWKEYSETFLSLSIDLRGSPNLKNLIFPTKKLRVWKYLKFTPSPLNTLTCQSRDRKSFEVFSSYSTENLTLPTRNNDGTEEAHFSVFSFLFKNIDWHPYAVKWKIREIFWGSTPRHKPKDISGIFLMLSRKHSSKFDERLVNFPNLEMPWYFRSFVRNGSEDWAWGMLYVQKYGKFWSRIEFFRLRTVATF